VLVQLAEVEVGEVLTGEVTDGEPLARGDAGRAVGDAPPEEIKERSFPEHACEQPLQLAVVDTSPPLFPRGCILELVRNRIAICLYRYVLVAACAVSGKRTVQ
jgi:hypothetical protein